MSRGRRGRPGRGEGDRGSSATETAVVYPVALLLILFTIQFGMWWYSSHVAHAVADTALAAARAEHADSEQARLEAVGLLDQLGGDRILPGATVNVDRTDLDATVTVEGAAMRVVPWLTLPVRVELSGPADRFVPAGGG